MTYRVSYEDGWVPVTGAARSGVERAEYFRSEHAALQRARELIDSGLHHGIAIYDSEGNALVGVRLHLKLGACVSD
jgi:hypothetical protein